VIRRGLSLMEVILATALLMAATVTIGRVAFVTTKNAQRAEDRAIAAQIAEHQLQQMLLGQQPVQAKSRGPVLPPSSELESTETSASPQEQYHPWDEWEVAFQVQATPIPQLYQVQVDVFRLRVDSSNGSSSATSDPSQDSNTEDILFTYSVVRFVRVSR
jgi:type II secretory pathway pseudopilin PulG